MSAENAWRIAMEAAMAEAEEVEINPIPSLWNFGTTPRPADRAEWKGRKEGAQDVRVLLASLPMPPAFRAEVEAEMGEVVEMLREAREEMRWVVWPNNEEPALMAHIDAILSRLEAKGESHE